MLDTPAFQEYVHSRSFLSRLGLARTASLRFSPLGQGEYNANFLFTHPNSGKRLVLRVNTGSQLHLADQIRYEFHALQELQSSGRTPKALFCDDTRSILPYGVLVMEWLPGRPLRYQTDLPAAAAILADIHAVPVRAENRLLRPKYPLESIYQECLAMAARYFDWDQSNRTVARLIEQMIEELGRLPLRSVPAAPPCIVSTELNSGNFLINTPGHSFLIDWEKPVLSEPAQDLGHFLVPTTTFWKTDVILKPAEIRAFVRHYRAAAGGRFDIADLKERLPLYFSLTCLRGVAWCAMAAVEYSRPGRPLVNRSTAQKIDDYLSEDFIRSLLDNYVRRDFLREDGCA